MHCSQILAISADSIIGLLLLIAFPFKTAESLFLYFVLIYLVLATAPLVVCIPREWLQLPAIELPPDTKAAGCARCVVKSTSAFLQVLRDWCTGRKYRPFLAGMLAATCFQAGNLAFGAVMYYFVEDWTSVGADSQEFISGWMAVATLVTMACVFHMGKLVDHVGPLKVIISVSFLTALTLFQLLVIRNPANIAVNIVLQNATLQLLIMAQMPFVQSLLPNPLTIGRDIAAFWSVSSALASGSVVLITPLVGAFGGTGKVMLGGRDQYLLEGYWLVTTICFVVVVLAAPLYWLADGLLRRASRPRHRLV